MGATDAHQSLWVAAVNTACFIRNWLITQSCGQDCTPFEFIHGRAPDIGHFRECVCKAFVHKPAQNPKGKFESRCEVGTLVVFCGEDAYRVLMSANNTMVESKDMKFNEASKKAKVRNNEKCIDFDIQDTGITFGRSGTGSCCKDW